MASETAVVESLVREHLPLVAHVVADVMVRVPRHVSRDELTSAALYGLAQAARSFDPGRGAPFEGYARRRMQGALLDELRSLDWASRGVRAQARKVRAASDQLTASLGRTPTAAETGAAAGLSEAEVERLSGDVHRATVLNYDSIFRDSEDSEALTMAGTGMGAGSSAWGTDPSDVLMSRERAAYLRDAVDALPDRLRTVIVGCFFEERPMMELAAEFGVTESRISQIKAEALALLREGMEATLDVDVDDDAAPVVAPATVPVGRVARRKAAYFAAVAAGSSYRDRLASDPSRQSAVAADQAVSA
jgi:RNA polymerase sigma factor for flagellar operon FliA